MKNSPRKSTQHSEFWFYAIIFSGIIVYWNSFTVPFLFDDKLRILENLEIRDFYHPLAILNNSRPILNLTLAVNYAFGHYRVFGYHLFNLIIHISSTLLLFSILRKTLKLPVFKNRFTHASGIAGISALIWTVHPLNTESVTYLIQRSESLMGFFWFLSLYALIRLKEKDFFRWKAVSIIALLFGMGSKQAIITAPLILICYDYIFLEKSFQKVRKERFWFYLIMTFSLLVGFIWSYESYRNAPGEIVFPYSKISWFSYLFTETQVLIHYLKLSVWPHPLCLDYVWPPLRDWKTVFIPSILISGIFIRTVKALAQRKPASFLGIWFFLILAPTSSFFAFPDLAFEHRMYLPLVSVVILGVLAGECLIQNFFKDAVQRKTAVFLISGFVIIVFGGLTIRRNQDYQSEISIWKDTISKRPFNSRAYNNLGVALAAEGKIDDALLAYEEAVHINPNHANAYVNMGNALTKQGNFEQALQYFKRSLDLEKNQFALNGLGVLYEKQKKYEEAYRYYLQALEGHPEYADAEFNIANVLMKLGKVGEAIPHFERALYLKPESAQIAANLGNAYLRQENKEKAKYYFLEALQTNPKDEIAQNSLGVLLATEGKDGEAIPHYMKAIKNKPDYSEPYNNLGGALLNQSRVDEAIHYFKEALHLNPDYALAQNNLKIALQKKAQQKS